MTENVREKGFHSWEIGDIGEKLAERILHKMGFTVVKFWGSIDEHPFTILCPKWWHRQRHNIAGFFSFDVYVEKGKEKWFIEVKTTEQKREHSIHFTNRQCRFGFALGTLGYKIGVLRIRLGEREGKRTEQARLYPIPLSFFENLFSKEVTIDYFPTLDRPLKHDRSINF